MSTFVLDCQSDAKIINNILKLKKRKNASGKNIDFEYLGNILESQRDEQIKVLIQSESQWVNAFIIENNIDYTTVKGKNFLVYEKIKDIFNLFVIKETVKQSLNNPALGLGYCIGQVKGGKHPGITAPFLAWLWRDHIEVATQFYADLNHQDLKPREYSVEVHEKDASKTIIQNKDQPHLIPVSTSFVNRIVSNATNAPYVKDELLRNPEFFEHCKANVISNHSRQEAINLASFDDKSPPYTKTNIYEILEGCEYILDSSLLDFCPAKPRSLYRMGGELIVKKTIQDGNAKIISDSKYFCAKDFIGKHLISVGSSKTCPTALMSLKQITKEVTGDLTKYNNNLYYSYDISRDKKILKESFGYGITQIPLVCMYDKNAKPIEPRTKIVDVIDNQEIHELTEDWGLLTILPNPFDATKKHISISACHGIGNIVLAQALNDLYFQTETKYDFFIDNSVFANDYLQVLIKVRTVWDSKANRYIAHPDNAHKDYEIVEVQKGTLATMYMTEDAMKTYSDLINNVTENKGASFTHDGETVVNHLADAKIYS